MAQTRKRRRRKHRGTQGGSIDRRGPRGRPRTREEARARASAKRKSSRGGRRDYAPSWRSSFNRAAIAAGIFVLVAATLLKQPIGAALGVAALMMAIYVPAGYYMERFFYRRRLAKERAERAARANHG
jgi:hypothetical protein